jgi:hypothetical protein
VSRLTFQRKHNYCVDCAVDVVGRRLSVVFCQLSVISCHMQLSVIIFSVQKRKKGDAREGKPFKDRSSNWSVDIRRKSTVSFIW